MKKVRIASICVISFLPLIFCYNATFGATLYVPDQYPTIQSGIDAAESGDTVIVALGIYTENIDFKGKDVAVTSQSGPGETIINGGRAGSVVTFWNGETNSAVLNGFTITNGMPLESMEQIYPFGGGISIRNASPIITGCTITGNAANDGGGIHIVGYQASPIIENNLISGNIAPSVGAGIVARDGASPVIRENIITENFTMQGSGIFISNDASPLIEDNVLQANYGGWCCMGREEALQFLDGIDIRENMGCGNFFPSTILVANRSSPVIRNNTITQNSSGGIGVFLNSSPIIDGNTIADNHGPVLLAGGLFVALNASPIVTNNTIQGNQGGALWIDNSSSIHDAENNPIPLTGFDVIEDADTRVAYSGNWGLGFGKVYSGGTIRMEGEAGAMASLAFTGTGISLIYFADSGAGKAGIRIDGIDYESVDMYCPDTMQYGKTEQVIATNLFPSEHTLTITVSGDKNPLSSGTGIALDAVGVLSGTTVGDNTVLGAVYWQPTSSSQSEISPGTILLVPDHHATIQSAIDAANPGDTIIVAPGTYQENLDFHGKNITLQSQSPDHAETVASTIIDANEVWPTVMFVSGETQGATLEGFTLRNSLGEKIIQISGASPNISKNTIKNATGSGIDCSYAESPLITANTIESNDADPDAVINCYFSSPLISGNRFNGNRSISISTYFSQPLILGNSFIDNQMTPIYLDHFSTATIRGNTISGTGPLTDHLGSGIVLDFFSDSIIESNMITDNQGDGIFMIIDASPVITNNIIARNREGLNVSISHPELINNTIVDNENGIYVRLVSRVLITNSIFLNDFEIGSEPYAEVSVIYSNVRGGYEGEGNLSQDPIFADDDYHLSGDSPCIDSGTSLNAPDMDIKGTARPQDQGYDMGAYEYDVTPPEIYTTFPQNGISNVDVNIEITAQFSENMDAATLTTESFKVNDESMDIPATVTWDGNTATLLPATNLNFDTTYTATLTTALKDLAGNFLVDGYTWFFTTCPGKIYYRDSDEDGYGDPLISIQRCSAPPGYVTDHTDGCDTDPLKTTPGTCGCGIADTDTDSDGTPDCNDGCDTDPLKAEPGICGCGVSDIDTDNDGARDCIDGCPDDPNKIVPGTCGCGVPDVDSDSDGTLDCNDNCPNDPEKTDPGSCGCSLADVDTDQDGVLDCNDNDDDNDGIDDDVEANGPNNGDANQDGILDSLQSHVACIHTFDLQDYLVIEATDGTRVSNFQLVDNPSPNDAPNNIEFSFGLVDFSIESIQSGGDVTATLTLPNGAKPDTYYKYGRTPADNTDHWYEFLHNGETGAKINGNTIILHFTDALRGDDVLVQDSMIIDLGGPGFDTTAVDLEPTATITSPGADTTIIAGGSVNFQCSIISGNAPFTFAWDFGGGASNMDIENPEEVTFATAGTYTVTLSITDDDGDTDTDSVTITVNAAGGDDGGGSGGGGSGGCFADTLRY